MNKFIFKMEQIIGRSLVALLGVFFVDSANAQQPFFIHNIPQNPEQLTQVIDSQMILEARDINNFSNFIKVKYQIQDFQNDEILNIISLDDIKEYQDQLKDKETPGHAAPNCIC
jgi:hypothetical protein